jgi:hypothetical protein
MSSELMPIIAQLALWGSRGSPGSET